MQNGAINKQKIFASNLTDLPKLYFCKLVIRNIYEY
jgi:hypothetical protein